MPSKKKLSVPARSSKSDVSSNASKSKKRSGDVLNTPNRTSILRDAYMQKKLSESALNMPSERRAFVAREMPDFGRAHQREQERMLNRDVRLPTCANTPELLRRRDRALRRRDDRNAQGGNEQTKAERASACLCETNPYRNVMEATHLYSVVDN